MLFILRENATQALSAAPEEKTNTVHVYSTKTGGWLRDLETCKRIVNIQNSPDEPNVLFGCTTSGVIVKWNVKNGGITKAIVSVSQGVAAARVVAECNEIFVLVRN